MPTFLAGATRGVVKKVHGPPGLLGQVVSGMEVENCLITRVALSVNTNQQFLHTLGDRIYLYVFGDRMGAMSVGGLAYFDCDSGTHGLQHAANWYENYRVSQSKEPVDVTVGGKNFTGFITGFNVDTRSVDEALLEFHFTLALIPPS